ncbi:MAG: FAD-dependent thymidylate synthase [Clostridia bacterium]
MNISLIGTTKNGYIADKKDFDNFSGKIAGICYMTKSFENLINENFEKTEKRIIKTKNSGHHSVYDHNNVTLCLENIPKALAMVLNNEKMYTTSEKSARYTKMLLKENEEVLYNKWMNIFKDLIKTKYQQKFPDFFNDSKIEKLAQENARYFISVFTPTSMIYTTSYRQLNCVYAMMKNEINKKNQNKFYKHLSPYMQEFCASIEKISNYIDPYLIKNEKNRSLSLFDNRESPLPDYFNYVYSTNYKGSFAQLAEAQRHRTIGYNINLLNKNEFYIPPILKNSELLKKEWENDCNKNTTLFPQGLMLCINEFGTLDNFILKAKERKCTFAQLEINQQTNETLKKYALSLLLAKNPLAKELQKYLKGARCTFPDYTCLSQCKFTDGITEVREI